MILKSKNKIAKTAWQAFEEFNAEKKIKKENIFSPEDTFCEVEMTGYGLTSIFKANIKYWQIQEYEVTDEGGNNTTLENRVLMFDENFVLDGQPLQDLWEYLGGDQTPITNINEGLMDFYLNGFLARMGISQILGLTSEDWDVIADDKIVAPQQKETQKSIKKK